MACWRFGRSALLLGWALGGCDPYPSQRSMNAEPHQCPPGTTGRTEPWGAGKGWLRSCVKYEGPWVVWGESGKIIEGEYHDNLRSGRWTYYDGRGRVSGVENYEDGGLIEGDATNGTNGAR